MIIKYYGGNVLKRDLLEMTSTNKDGTSAYHLKETLIQLGFDAKGVKVELENITKENLILPCIASVTLNKSYNHFIVIYEINFKHKYLIIADPIDKIKKIKYDDFNNIFNKILIICFPVKTIPFSNEFDKSKLILNLLKPHKNLISNIIILSIFITIFSIIASFYTECIIDSLNLYSKNYLFLIFLFFFSIYSFKNLTNYFRNKVIVFVNQKLDLILTLDIFKKIIILPYSYYQNKMTGDILSRINDLDILKEAISKVLISLFIDLPLTLFSMLFLLIINKTLFIIGIIIMILYFVLIILFKKGLNFNLKSIKRQKGEYMSYMVEGINGFETIKGINIQDDIINRFEKKYVTFLNSSFKYYNLYFLQQLLKDFVDNFGFILIILIGAIFVIDNKMTLGSLFTFSSLLMYFLEPIKNIMNLDLILKETKNSLERIGDILTYPKGKDGILNEIENFNIEFKNLNFSFNNKMVLKNINIYISSGKKVMIVGKSGSGKSTLFKLLKRYYKIDFGKIFIDDIDINYYSNSVLNENIVYISQSEILFNDTLYNNLIFDNSNVSYLLKVVDLCYINKFIDSRLGLNMLIEENGTNLSGGEKQRIVLARSLLKHFNVLIIDEGLSQLDINLERKILKNLFKEFSTKTIILISHRLNNQDLFDDVINISDGRARYS